MVFDKPRLPGVLTPGGCFNAFLAPEGGRLMRVQWV